MAEVLTLAADRVVSASGDWSPGWLTIADGRIRDCGSGITPDAGRDRGSARLERLSGTLIPGLVDIHAHGALGVDFGAADALAARRVAAHHASLGTTTLLASLASAPIGALERGIRTLRPLVEDGTLAGIHLEGAYLSPRRRGAHDLGMLRSPDLGEMRRLVGAGGGAVRMVTLAPELDGAEVVVRWLAANGVTVALGHSECDADTARAAFGWGARVVTHLFNGMAPLHHRAAGLVGAALVDQRVTLELILDGQHVGPEAVEIARRTAPGRIALVSDAMSATGCPDGAFTIAGSPVRVRDGVATTADGSSLAGSTSTLGVGLAILLSTTGVTLREAVAATSTTAAQAIGLPHSGIHPGAAADLLLLGDGGVTRVMRRGEWLR
ncbi:N-acetylglucosamine-6-phosphate deacetylase [Lysinimonas soli]|uniref:N-acetylglucosamine-6-phosphate deacetylase n=1 Tax=Lysinimonas soli TaxID=1074233 RepID=A0ABW0NJB9_9MICO